MNVLMIEPLGKGGITHYTYNLLKNLSSGSKDTFMLFTAVNYEFKNQTHPFICFPRMFRFAQRIINYFPFLENQTVWPSRIRRCIKILEYPFNGLEAFFLLKKEGVDCVHIQSVNLTELFMIVLFRLARVKIVYTIHNVNLLHRKMRFYHLFLLKISYNLTHQLIIHSRAGKAEVIDRFNISPEKINVIPHGDYSFFMPDSNLSKVDAKTALGISGNTKTLLFFGSIRPSKGLSTIILALPMVKQSINPVKLLIIGEPYESYKSYRALIEQNSLQDDIYEKLDYIPHEEVSLYFAAADLVVLPYREITHSGVLQIAYAFGRPVVATDLDGFREAVEDGQNGYLVKPDNPELLAEKIVRIFSDDSRIIEMGHHSQHLSETRYSWDSIARQTIALYDNCLIQP
jgi:glycosyltransferase involved in cell wall biosynthesis